MYPTQLVLLITDKILLSTLSQIATPDEVIIDVALGWPKFDCHSIDTIDRVRSIAEYETLIKVVDTLNETLLDPSLRLKACGLAKNNIHLDLRRKSSISFYITLPNALGGVGTNSAPILRLFPREF